MDKNEKTHPGVMEMMRLYEAVSEESSEIKRLTAENQRQELEITRLMAKVERLERDLRHAIAIIEASYPDMPGGMATSAGGRDVTKELEIECDQAFERLVKALESKGESDGS